MIFTRSLLRSWSGFFAGLLVVVLSAPSYAADWDLDQLMHGLAQTRSGHARFVEKKSIAILEQPVESSGDLLYTAPDRLEKRTLKPKLETMVVNGDNLQIERGRQKIQLQLQTYPELAAFIDSIRGTLAGDRKDLPTESGRRGTRLDTETGTAGQQDEASRCADPHYRGAR
jgi:outer membrane lipoprotein-sorting protein